MIYRALSEVHQQHRFLGEPGAVVGIYDCWSTGLHVTFNSVHQDRDAGGGNAALGRR